MKHRGLLLRAQRELPHHAQEASSEEPLVGRNSHQRLMEVQTAEESPAFEPAQTQVPAEVSPLAKRETEPLKKEN